MQNNTSVGLKQLRLWCTAGFLFWSLLLTGSLVLYLKHEWQSVEFIGKKIGLAAVNKDYVYELWNARNGGVYIPVNDGDLPNPYLPDVTDRDIITPSGKKLTLINPARMTRQIYQLEQEIYGVGGRITSLDAVSSEYMPDAWEKEALLSFVRGEKEASELIRQGEKTLMRVMMPAITREACLKCHIRKNDQSGDIRGGISITFPIDGIVALFHKQFKTSALYHLLIYLMGVTGLVIFYVQTSRQMKKRTEIEKQLRLQTEEWQSTFDAIPDIITIQDSRMRIIRANRATYQFFGAKPDELVGTTCYSLFRKEDNLCPGCPGIRSIHDGTQHCNTQPK
ncbi:MAG: DUF3365 domain-containing protein, partial [Candidatus Electrothrix sp. AUS1_2]|nr:DUF3365 domain-containing protein [Candidatus Electrothrix sp. AUS1_2]